MNCSLSGSSTQEILPARLSEWVAISFSAVKRNAFESVLMRWMNLEPILQSEVNKKETNIIYEYIFMGSRKMVLMNLFAKQ